MKMKDALQVIEGSNKVFGFMVSFERTGGGMLRSDHFPDKHRGEKLIELEDEAWELARKFAKKTRKKCVNIYVVDQDFSPTTSGKTIKNR